jgi:hypothetical protein
LEFGFLEPLRQHADPLDGTTEDIAFMPYGLNVVLLARVIAQATSQPANPQVNRSVEGFRFAPRELLKEFTATDRAVRMIE